MLKTFLFFFILTLSALFGRAQTGNGPFPIDSVETLLRKGINSMRAKIGLDTLTSNGILQSASETQSAYMAKTGKAELTGSGKKYKDTGSRLRAFGGSQKGEEIVFSISVSKGKDHLSAKEISGQILKKWNESKKEKPIILNGNYVLVGLSVNPDATGKKIYISMVLSGYDLINDGAKKKSELKTPFTSSTKRIKPSTQQACKNCIKFKDYDSLRLGLYVNQKGYVCLKYSDINAVKKLLKKPGDGIAVDIIQRAQYEKPAYNILDNNLLTKGILIKPVSGEKLFKNNKARFEAKTKGKKVKKEQNFDAVLGKFPKGIKGEFEMNLLILQDGKLCKVIKQSYVESGNQEGKPCEMLLMPDSSAYLKPLYKPKAESGLLTFTIPFEKNKSDYREEDIKPFLDAMQEPDYTIEGIYITAYSSIEGDSNLNSQLQKNRAKSIIEVLKNIQKGSNLVSNIITSDSWLLFTMEMEDGKYDYLTKMSKQKAIRQINTVPGLVDSLEPVLSKERFAQMILDVTYDITGSKEENFCIKKFNNAVRQGDVGLAEKIQFYVQKNVAEKHFSENAMEKLQIPLSNKFSGLLMNSLIYGYFKNNHRVSVHLLDSLQIITTIDPSNNYAKYNLLFCRMNLEPMSNPEKSSSVQAGIDGLYLAADFPKKYADALNTELQFRIMNALDTVEGSEALIINSINKIQSFYNIKEANWKNSLKLAYAFIKHKEFDYPASLLEPFVLKDKPDEELVFTYISTCSNVPERLYSHAFSEALRKAHEINSDRYCKLFGTPNLSFQVLEIPQVKEDYLNFNCAK